MGMLPRWTFRSTRQTRAVERAGRVARECLERMYHTNGRFSGAAARELLYLMQVVSGLSEHECGVVLQQEVSRLVEQQAQEQRAAS